MFTKISFRIRDLLYLTTFIACILGWVMDSRSLRKNMLDVNQIHEKQKKFKRTWVTVKQMAYYIEEELGTPVNCTKDYVLIDGKLMARQVDWNLVASQKKRLVKPWQNSPPYKVPESYFTIPDNYFIYPDAIPETYYVTP